MIETSSKEAALDTLQQSNMIVTSIEERKTGLMGMDIFRRRVKSKDIVVFSRQLATLFEARIPVVQAFKTLVGETSNPVLQKTVAQILDDISGGLALSQALAKHPNVFSAFFISLVRSGEESGKLQEVFSYLADYLERSNYLTTKARNSMIYPAFILLAFMGVLVVMLVVVIPKLMTIFQETGQQMPFYTQLIMYLSLFLQKWGVAVLILLIAGALFVWRWSQTVSGKLFFHQLQLSLPVFGGLYKKLYMARFTDNLRTLIMGGIPILRSLSISGDVVGNVIYQKAIADAIESVKGGGTISDALEKAPDIPVLVTQMMRIGEATGRLDFILGSIAKFYQREVDSALENLVAMIEPILIIVLGAGVGLLVASVLVPMYNMVGSI